MYVRMYNPLYCNFKATQCCSIVLCALLSAREAGGCCMNATTPSPPHCAFHQTTNYSSTTSKVLMQNIKSIPMAHTHTYTHTVCSVNTCLCLCIWCEQAATCCEYTRVQVKKLNTFLSYLPIHSTNMRMFINCMYIHHNY